VVARRVLPGNPADEAGVEAWLDSRSYSYFSEAAQGDAQSELVCKGKWHFGIFTLFVYAGRYQWTAQQAGRTEEM